MAIIPRFEFWNPSTWVIPKLYWDAFSQEQRIHAICRQLGKIIGYVDYMGVNVNDIAERLKAIEDGQLDDMIQAEIEQWFEDNEPFILSAINIIEAEIGQGFGADNTISDAISELRADVDDLEPLKGRVTALEAKYLTEPVFDVKSRIAYATADINPFRLQSGCVWEQGGVLYCAYWMATDDPDYSDQLYIVDLDANAHIATMVQEVGHGQCLSYNPTTKQLVTCGEKNGIEKAWFISVADPYAPYVVNDPSTPPIPGSWANTDYPQVVCWDDDHTGFWVLKLSADQQHLYIVHTDGYFVADADPVLLDAFDYWDYPHIYQSIDVKDGVLYLSQSLDEQIVILDVHTGERLNTIDVPEWVSFLKVQEIEFACVCNGKMYVSDSHYYPGYVVPAVYEWNMTSGTIAREKLRNERNTGTDKNKMQYVRIGWNTANLLSPYDTAHGATSLIPCFKFVEDAIEWARHWGIVPQLNFIEDYPSCACVEGMKLAIAPASAVNIGGFSFNLCDVRMTDIDRITFTGERTGTFHTATYAYFLWFDTCRVAIESDLWTTDNTLYPDLALSNGYFARSFVTCYPVTEWGVATFNGCAIVNRSGSHATVVNQSGNIWLNG